MTWDRYFKKKTVLPDPHGDLSLTIHPTVIASMNCAVELTRPEASTSASTSESVGKRKPYNKYARKFIAYVAMADLFLDLLT